MRGAPLRVMTLSTVQGIIPADAGSTVRSCGPATVWEDHPRGCGEHLISNCSRNATRGSSPRMRGAPSAPAVEAATIRIIPADAGSTTRTSGRTGRRWDHPRGCGEHCDGWVASDRLEGSSPRMRGAQESPTIPVIFSRIIPADAGSTN